MPDTRGTAFAQYGGEKMIYDLRMGPQAVLHKDTLYVVYPANPDGPEAHPHILTRDMETGNWSEPQRIGTVPRYDHHYCPVLWFDGEDRLHVLYGCHGRDGGRHIVSADPLSTERWVEGPTIATSISYPHILPMADDRLVIYYRVLGHMGYWAYRISRDGGYTWDAPHKVVDMDRDPETGTDCWAGSYHTVIASPDRRALHVGFVYLDEQKRLNPLYNRRFATKRTLNRYHLYYLHLDLDSGKLANAQGETLDGPVNRSLAEKCKIWETGWRLTMQPAILADDNEPRFLLPVSSRSPWECRFHFVHSHNGHWDRVLVAETNHTWNGCLLTRDSEGDLLAHVIVNRDYGEVFTYGGGDLEKWGSSNGGKTWLFRGRLDPEPGLLYNNPRLVEDAQGNTVPGYLLFFGWRGPSSIDPNKGEGGPVNRGKAFLRHNGKWL